VLLLLLPAVELAKLYKAFQSIFLCAQHGQLWQLNLLLL
jgi:hypothetical protein